MIVMHFVISFRQ
uniref:Uncharacterized protein n=1 Tax=Rhizophora mucronata TaxID=61149 RepID=A0A2P2J3K6_RHIMU